MVADRLVVAFDLDGTVVEDLPIEAFESGSADLASPKPVPHVVAWAKRLQDYGVRIVVVTGRHYQFNALTKSVVQRLGLGELPILARAASVFEVEAAVGEKAAHLRNVGAVLMVGDRDDLDGGAARAAGCAFLHVDRVPRGDTIIEATK